MIKSTSESFFIQYIYSLFSQIKNIANILFVKKNDMHQGENRLLLLLSSRRVEWLVDHVDNSKDNDEIQWRFQEKFTHGLAN